jgi:26S proteasome regulatory subunit N7
MAEEVVLPIPNLTLPQNLYVLSNPALKHLHENARSKLLEGIKADGTRFLLLIVFNELNAI